jgi:prepilin-type N-terminal cleavage/methylation domain-containing protein
MKCAATGSSNGFTLLEVMVALIIGTVIVGGVMGVISVSLQYSKRVQDRSQYQPVLEAAAQMILAHPELAEQGAMNMKNLPSAPPVNVAISPVTGSDGEILRGRSGQLFRVQLSCAAQVLEFSVIIPQSQLK